MGIGDAGDEINRRTRANQNRVERMWRKGLVTQVDNGHTPPLAWVSDGSQTRRMPATISGLSVGDVVFFNDQKDPFVHGRVDTGGSGGAVPNIWTCTTMRRGATTWTSALGDVRTLSTNVARHATEGGIVVQPDTLSSFQVQPIAGGVNFNAVDVVRWDLDITTWWATPAGKLPEDYGAPYFYEWNFAWAVVPPHWWATNDPLVPTVTDGLASPAANGIPLDPATVGAADWDRLFLRIEYNQATGATQAWLAVIDDVTFNLVSQGTATLAAATAGSGVQFEDMGFDKVYGSLLTGWGPNVVHGCVVNEREPGGDGTLGQQLYGFQVNNIDMRGERWTGRNAPTQHIIGSAMVNDGTMFYQNYDNDITIVPEGAPLWTAIPGGTTKPIWTDGEDLRDPAIAWAPRSEPNLIQVETGVQPQNWDVPVSSPNDQAFIYAVADRASAAALDSNGWPLNWFPFGPLRAT